MEERMRPSVRDKRSPVPLNENTVKSMQGNRRKNTGPEMKVRKMLRDMGYPGYRLQWKAPGHPDIAYPGRKVAILVNGCFWHRCPKCNMPIPEHNKDYWTKKFDYNVRHDRETLAALQAEGWKVVVIWECEVGKEPETVRKRLSDALSSRPRSPGSSPPSG
jgi:DNA mismatch endonuclease (patch repair protein)